MNNFLTFYIPNLLSYIRIFLTPIIIYSIVKDPGHFKLGCVLFIIAMITDFLDGKIARYYNIISEHGAFIDPFADKVLIIGSLSAFAYINTISFLVVGIVIIRELSITLLRMYAQKRSYKFKTAWHGKLKTLFQAISIIGLFLFKIGIINLYFVHIVIAFMLLITVYSGMIYLTGYKK